MRKEGKNLVAKALKRILEPFYQKLSIKLKADLQVAEQQRLLHHLIGRVDTLSIQQLALTNQIKTTSLIVSGVYNSTEDETSTFWSASIIYDIFAILKNQSQSSISVFNYFNEITQVALKGKSIIFVSGVDPLYSQIAKKQGAESIVRIEMNPFVANKRLINDESRNEKVIFVYPTNMATLSYPLVDLLFVPRQAVASFLIKYHLFNLGSRVKQKAFITLAVKTYSVFSTSKTPPFSLEENQSLTIFNDNYIRRQLHKAGFFEVKCIDSQGIGIKNKQFDKKVTHLSYQDNYKVVRDNKLKDKKLFNDNHMSIKTYVANKLPELT